MKLLLAFVPFITFALLEHRVGTHAALVAARPAFRRTAERIAWAWAGAFVVIVLADLAMMYVPAFTTTVGTVVILAALGAAAWFTASLPKAARR
ncbi:hypothetical protein LMG26690_02550 [Achromobacter animicus]|uniref:Uncharacterized protein n=1 Tax=Achromobacter animicus TaxID=1389935 RepID=A0A6S6ZVN5_9BURK|nr:hypothetical protein [Achromobacter animicus]CAB3699586.1 hypothetical protein LMG26690_02550 [Achromobacter animicus]